MDGVTGMEGLRASEHIGRPLHDMEQVRDAIRRHRRVFLGEKSPESLSLPLECELPLNH